MKGLVSIERYLVETGTAISSRAALHMIKSGRIKVSGKVCIDTKLKIDTWNQAISLDGQGITQEVPLLCQYHKPKGIFPTMHDRFGRPDLQGVIPVEWRRDMHPVSCLHSDASGIVVFCASAELTRRLRRNLQESYLVQCALDKTLSKIKLATHFQALIHNQKTKWAGQGLREVTLLDDFKTEETKDHNSIRLRLILSSNGGSDISLRKAKKLLAHLPAPIVHLHRVQCGPVHLSTLPVGDFEPLFNHDALSWATNSLLHNFD